MKMDVTAYLLELIKKEYKSVRQFSIAIGVPYSTIKSGLSNGIGGMAVDTIIKMCNALNIKVDELMSIQDKPAPQNAQEKELLEIYQKAKESDKAEVKTLLKIVDKLLGIDK